MTKINAFILKIDGNDFKTVEISKIKTVDNMTKINAFISRKFTQISQYEVNSN